MVTRTHVRIHLGRLIFPAPHADQNADMPRSLLICIVACMAEASGKVEAFKPIDEADRIDDWLYLPEVLYALMLFAVICAGPGGYSIDRLLGL